MRAAVGGGPPRSSPHRPLAPSVGRFVSSGRTSGTLGAASCRGEREVEAVPAARQRLDADHSIVMVDDRAADRQAQTGTVDATALMGPPAVGLEDAGAILRWHR